MARVFTRNQPASVREVPLPEGSLAAGAFAVTHYADAFALSLPAGAPHDIDALVRALMSSWPWWVGALMRVRNGAASLVGLKTGSIPPALPADDAPFQRGDHAGIFPVIDRTGDEILMGADDRHLNFRASLLTRTEAGGRTVVLSTVVHYNGRLGRCYFLFVRPFHRMIIPALLRRLRRGLGRDVLA